MSLASVAEQQQSAGPSTPAGSGNAGQSALNSLSGNFNSFLSMLMTQLKNQDPTSPLDTNQFTSQLVQFSSVEQQISTNSSLAQLISLTQAGEVVQSTSMLGHRVSAKSDHIPLQNGTGAVSFTTDTTGPVAIAISNPQGTVIRAATTSGKAGENTWAWNGKDENGDTVPDGTYGIAVSRIAGDGSVKPLEFTVAGTATSVTATGKTVQLQLGKLAVDFTSIRSVFD